MIDACFLCLWGNWKADSQTQNEMDSILRKAGSTGDTGHHFRTGLIPECVLLSCTTNISFSKSLTATLQKKKSLTCMWQLSLFTVLYFQKIGLLTISSKIGGDVGVETWWQRGRHLGSDMSLSSKSAGSMERVIKDQLQYFFSQFGSRILPGIIPQVVLLCFDLHLCFIYYKINEKTLNTFESFFFNNIWKLKDSKTNNLHWKAYIICPVKNGG